MLLGIHRGGAPTLGRVGIAEPMTITFRQEERFLATKSLGGVEGVEARYREDGELLVINRGEKKFGFAICQKCGYADSETKPHRRHRDATDFRAVLRVAPVPSDLLRGFRVAGDPMRRQFGGIGFWLHARQLTSCSSSFRAWGSTPPTQHLFRLSGLPCNVAGCQMLQLDTREIGVLIVPAGTQGQTFGVSLYDNVPGGAGHVRELLDQDRELFDAAPFKCSFGMKLTIAVANLPAWSACSRSTLRAAITAECRSCGDSPLPSGKPFLSGGWLEVYE